MNTRLDIAKKCSNVKVRFIYGLGSAFSAIALWIIFGTVVPLVFASEKMADQVTDESVVTNFKEINRVKVEDDPKHVPKIDAPDKVKAGEWFDVTVTVGAGALHPTLFEHHVRWIAIYKGEIELARAYLHPIHTKPKVTFTIALEESVTLRAMEEPNHASPFESSKEIKVIK